MTNIEKLLAELNSGEIALYFSNDLSETHEASRMNFYNYTNIKESDAILLVDKDEEKAHLFIPSNTEYYLKWIGKRIEREEASTLSNIPLSNIHYLGEDDKFFKNYLDTLIRSKKNPVILFDLDNKDYLKRPYYLELIKKEYPNVLIRNSNLINQKIRAIKTANQIEDLKIAIQITNEGIKELMLNSKVCGKEYQLESFFDKIVKYHNAEYSFKTIAASGINATCLHYEANNSDLNSGELILFDLGARYNKVCADISRTFPINGKFSKKQRAVYEAVLRTNKKIISMVKPGTSMRELQVETNKLLADELKELGLIKEDKEVIKYYFHGIGHHLGLLCHDEVPTSTILAPGMVVTVEPGLYISEWNIGVRIEDDILVTEDGAINLSSDIIKEVEDIEEFMK